MSPIRELEKRGSWSSGSRCLQTLDGRSASSEAHCPRTRIRKGLQSIDLTVLVSIDLPPKIVGHYSIWTYRPDGPRSIDLTPDIVGHNADCSAKEMANIDFFLGRNKCGCSITVTGKLVRDLQAPRSEIGSTLCIYEPVGNTSCLINLAKPDMWGRGRRRVHG